MSDVVRLSPERWEMLCGAMGVSGDPDIMSSTELTPLRGALEIDGVIFLPAIYVYARDQNPR